jgi:hypothetical protein
LGIAQTPGRNIINKYSNSKFQPHPTPPHRTSQIPASNNKFAAQSTIYNNTRLNQALPYNIASKLFTKHPSEVDKIETQSYS